MRHVQVTDGDGQVDGLADDAARMVETPDLVVHPGEVAEILDRRIAATTVEIVNERRSETRAEDHRIAAHTNAVFGIAGVLDKRSGRRANPVAAPAGIEPDAFAIDARTCCPEDLQGLGVSPKLHADLVQDSIGVAFDDHGRVRIEEIEHRYLADEKRRGPGRFGGPRLDLPSASGPSPGHVNASDINRS